MPNSVDTINFSLEEQLKKFELVISSVANAVMICDENGDIEWVNNGFTNLTGFLPDEVIGKDPFDCLYSSLSDQEKKQELHLKVTRGEIVKEIILNHDKQGNPYWLELIVNPIFNENKILKNYIVIGVDVNDRVKGSREIEDKANLLESIASAMPVVTYIWNIEDYKLDFISNHIFDLTGYTKEEFLNDSKGNKFISIAFENDVQKLRDSYIKITNDPKINSTTNSFRIKHRSGDIKRVTSREVVYKRNLNGKATHLICTMNDVTEHYNAEKYREALIRLQELQQKRTQKIRSLTMLRGQEEERKRLSRELHDGIGQMLTAIRIKVNNLESETDKSQINIHLSEIKNLVAQTIKETRNISNALLPVDLHDYGLLASLKQLFENTKKHASINISFNTNFSDIRFNTTIEVEVYRIAQEALNNSLKYSKSNTIDANLFYNVESEILKLIIIDEGIGFEYENNFHSRKNKNTTFGLRNMHERARIINGKLNIISQSGQGCVVSLEVPVKQNEL